MRTREESLNSLCLCVDNLINSKYLLAGAGIFDVCKIINGSKLLSDMFNYFTDGFDFEGVLTNAIKSEGGVKSFVLPDKNTDALALVYLLLREINYKNIQLVDLLDCFDSNKNYEKAYSVFCSEVLVPFKSYVYQVGTQIINGTQGDNLTQNIAQTEEVNEELSKTNQIDFEPASEKTKKLKKKFKRQEGLSQESVQAVLDGSLSDTALLRRLLDLDKLAIKQSKLNDDVKDELLYVLNLFDVEIKLGDPKSVKLACLVYYYALLPYPKLKSNIKSITEVLINQGIL